MRTTIQIRSNPVGDAVLAASRQVWLASLGAAVVTRDWAQTEAGNVFRTLVKEGTAVESQADPHGRRPPRSLVHARQRRLEAGAHDGPVDGQAGRRHRGHARAEQPAEVAAEGHAAGDAEAVAAAKAKRAAKKRRQGQARVKTRATKTRASARRKAATRK